MQNFSEIIKKTPPPPPPYPQKMNDPLNRLNKTILTSAVVHCLVLKSFDKFTLPQVQIQRIYPQQEAFIKSQLDLDLAVCLVIVFK